ILANVKDPLEKWKQANLVYEVPCSQCNVSYIGETSRRLEDRLKEHRKAVQTADVRNSVLAEHVASMGHLPDWEATKVLRKCSGYFERKWAEAVEIAKHKYLCNRDGGYVYKSTHYFVHSQLYRFLFYFIFLFET